MPIGQASGRVQHGELDGQRDREDDADPDRRHAERVGEEGEQRVEDGDDHPQVGEVRHEDHREPGRAKDTADGRHRAARRPASSSDALRCGHEPQIDERSERRDAGGEEQRAREPQPVGDHARGEAASDDSDVEGPVEDGQRPRHALLGNGLQELAVHGREHDRRADAGTGVRGGRERIRRRQPRECGHDGDDGEPACRREALAYAVDDDAAAEIGEQPRERVDGDEYARGFVAAAERSREERQDRERDAGAEHEHEREQDDDADRAVGKDPAHADCGPSLHGAHARRQIGNGGAAIRPCHGCRQ